MGERENAGVRHPGADRFELRDRSVAVVRGLHGEQRTADSGQQIVPGAPTLRHGPKPGPSQTSLQP